MNIGITIKKYRHQQDLTQEQLAEYLNVSVSAVSQWESGKTIPDVSTILGLANFFDVTLDELFGRNSKEKEKELEKYHELETQYAHDGEVEKRLSVWREATQKYPGDFNCLIKLADALTSTVYIDGDEEEIEKNAQESIAICERILRDCNDNDIRSFALQYLVHLHSNKDLPTANEEKAVKYAMMADSLFTCQEVLLETAYFTEESKDKKKKTKHLNILNYMDLLTMNLYYGKYEREEDIIDACNAALTLWKTLIYDENYQFFHCRIQKIYLQLAISYAKLQKPQETIYSLKKAVYHAKCYDNLPQTEQPYTSMFVNGATSDASEFTKNYTVSNVDNIIRCSKSKLFDFIRDSLDFDNI